MSGPALRVLGGDGASLAPPRPSPPFGVFVRHCHVGNRFAEVTLAVMPRGRWLRWPDDLRTGFWFQDVGPLTVGVRIFFG